MNLLFLLFLLGQQTDARTPWHPATPEGYPFPIYSQEFFKLNGAVKNPSENTNHFYWFKKDKRPGVIRVGVFGDSHAEGAEVDPAYSWSVLLQKLFEQNGNQNVEVINFAKGGYGFQQAYVTWENIGVNYSLDYVTFGPRGFQQDRDLGFSKWSWLLRGRFILNPNGNSVQFVHGTAPNEDHSHNYENLKSRFPLWRFFRYDLEGPPRFRKLFSWLGRNPFYYSSIEPGEEHLRITHILMRRILKKYPQRVLTLVEHKKELALLQDLIPKLALDFPMQQLQRFPYRQFQHQSSYGEEQWARIYYSHLLGKKVVEISDIKCRAVKQTRPLTQQTPSQVAQKRPSISNFKGFQVFAGDFLLGQLNINKYELELGERELFFKQDKALLAFAPFKNPALTNSILYTLPFVPTAGERVFVASIKGEKQILGTLEQPFADLPIFTIHSKKIKIIEESDSFPYYLEFINFKEIPKKILFEKSQKSEPISYENNKYVFRERSAESYSFWGAKNQILGDNTFTSIPLTLKSKLIDNSSSFLIHKQNASFTLFTECSAGKISLPLSKTNLTVLDNH